MLSTRDPPQNKRHIQTKSEGVAVNILYACALCDVHYFCLVAKSCLTLCDSIYCSPPGSSVHGISR